MVPDVDLMRMLRYEAWANQEVAASLEQAGIAAPLRALSIMAHIIGASRLWLARAHEQPSDLAVWPSLEISCMRRELGSSGK